MNTAYDNNLYQMSILSPDSDPADHIFETRYNAAYSSQPNTPSSGQLVHAAATTTHSVHQGAQDVVTDEQAFGQSVASFMTEYDIQNTLKQFVSSCLGHSRELRAEALQNQHRAVRLMHLQAEATALEAEAATWELLLHMYAETHRTYPAGTGGQQTAINTVHHQVAEAICDRRPLLQCARVVTWLEALFCKSQQYRAEQEQGPRFHDHSGVWTDTHIALHRQDHVDGLVSELDPDATTRQKASLQKDSSRDEDALNAYLFELVKAGRVSEAAETCAACGQPWRAASLLGGGPNGPLPLGPAADAQGQVKALEQLSAEVEANSSIALRTVWKWTCYQVAEAAAQHCSHQSEDAGKHEAALYGALAGHLQRILPVCHTRADVLWAYTRCWLESQVDRHLAESSGKGDLVSGLQVGKDAVASTQQDSPEEVQRVVLDDVADFLPPSSSTKALPDTLEAVLEAAQQAADSKSTGDMEHWQLHQDIITEDFAALLSRFVEDGSAQVSSASASKPDRQKAVKLRLGAHLALALGYLPVSVPTPQDALTIRTEEDIQADPDPDTQHLHSSDDLPLRETANQLMEQYTLYLIKTEQHELVPLYACLMRQDVRRKTYTHYLLNLTQYSVEDCLRAYELARGCFDQWHRGDIEIGTELDQIVEQVVHEAFWRIQDGPNRWAATLRWLCFSDTTLLLAATEANRVLRQLSVGGQAAMQAGLHFVFEALEASPILSSILRGEAGLADISTQIPAIARECEELLVWQDFYQLEGLHTDFDNALAEMNQEDDTLLAELCDLGQRYIDSAVEVCSSGRFDSIWTGQPSPYDNGSPSHEVLLWVAPAEDASSEAVQAGRRYSLVPSNQMPEFVAAVQANADACCVPGITAQVKEADPHCQAAIVTLTVSHADTDMGTEVQCLNAFIKRGVSLQSYYVPLHVIRMEGPDMCIGALAAMAAYPYILLQATQLRQVLLEADPSCGFGPELGDGIIPLVAGTDADKSTGLTYYFTQQELKELVELERLTQLQIERLHQGQDV